MGVEGRAKKGILIAAGILLIGALIWSVFITKDDELTRVAQELNRHGFAFLDADIYVFGETRDASIASLVSADELQSMTGASAAEGFPCDTETKGDIVVLLASPDEKSVVTMYMLDGKMQLCFVQTLESGEIETLSAYHDRSRKDSLN